MSHFTTVKTKIKSLTNLIAALQEMEVDFVQAEAGQMVKVRGYRGNEELADLCIQIDETYDIGVRKTHAGEYELVADWSELEDRMDTEAFMEKLTQRYAYHTVIEQIKSQGYNLDEQTQEEDGTIRMQVSSWQ